MKKTLSILLAAVMLLSFCAFGASAENEKPLAGLEFSILCTTWSPYTTETTLIPAIEEATGAKINIEWAVRTDFDTRVQTALADTVIPDVIMGASYLPLLDQEVIIPLDPYMTEENTPNILAALAPEDYVQLRNVADGHIYEIPSVFDFPEINSWVIRTDWAKKLGLDELKTWDDWMAYWRGIRDNDMNGDGDATNEVPLCIDYKTLRNAFLPEAGEGYFCLNDDGEYTVIYEHPNFKVYLETMVGMFQEGLLTSENFTKMDGKSICSAGLGGTMKTAAEWSMQITDALRQIEPEGRFECVPPIMTPCGTQIMAARAKVSRRGVITVAAEDKAADIMRLFDWLYSEEGADLMNYGIEGVHHEVVDGKKKLVSPYIDSFVNARAAGLIFQPFPFLWYPDNYLQILLNGKSYEELSETQQFFYDGLFLNDPYFVKVLPTLATEAYMEYGTDVFNTLSEAEAKCITGEISIDDFWSIYENCKANDGLDEIIEQGTEAYKKVAGN